MKSVLFIAFAILIIFAVACKGRDKCTTCPTFSELEKIDEKQVQY